MMRFLGEQGTRVRLGELARSRRCGYTPDSVAVQIVPVVASLVVTDRGQHDGLVEIDAIEGDV